MTKADIKKIIQDSIDASDDVEDAITNFCERIDNKKEDDEYSILIDILKLLREHRTNQNLLNMLSVCIQLQDDAKTIDLIELEVVTEILECNVRNQNMMNISFNEDLIYFYWAVMDDSDNSLHYVNETIKILTKKMKEFKKLKKEIEEYRSKYVNKN